MKNLGAACLSVTPDREQPVGKLQVMKSGRVYLVLTDGKRYVFKHGGCCTHETT